MELCQVFRLEKQLRYLKQMALALFLVPVVRQLQMHTSSMLHRQGDDRVFAGNQIVHRHECQSPAALWQQVLVQRVVPLAFLQSRFVSRARYSTLKDSFQQQQEELVPS
jgi:hypothetical protein